MFCGPPLPLAADFPLRQLVPLINGRQRTGCWVREAGAAHRLLISVAGRCVSVLIGGNLGALLAGCTHVVVREGTDPVVLDSEVLIQWRALQVVTGMPYLPGPVRLKEIFPAAAVEPDGFRVPTQSRSPEEILAECLAHGIPVLESRIVYHFIDARPPPPLR
jgi:hypothetical protein